MPKEERGRGRVRDWCCGVGSPQGALSCKLGSNDGDVEEHQPCVDYLSLPSLLSLSLSLSLYLSSSFLFFFFLGHVSHASLDRPSMAVTFPIGPHHQKTVGG
ncbi:hypothetical protein HPP92_013690 [Vanilla planifolia]|uniref:Uncharacterized protein n=1 Tax=Vanilla planifolia TaxID=51239 RepID=A0A835QVC9_VANPL|nr:hypothetical protein HPP92_013690 [Vanilla planifolia]